MDNLRFCIEHGIHAVVGTSGFDDGAARHRCAAGWPTRPTVGVRRRAELRRRRGADDALRRRRRRRFFESVEIVELHHPDKADAPSGTARRTAEIVAAARTRGRAGAGAGRHDVRAWTAPAARTSTGVPVHSVRARGLVAHQEVLLGTPGETLTIRHDSLRPRVVHAGRAARGPRGRPTGPGLTVGLEPLLGLG